VNILSFRYSRIPADPQTPPYATEGRLVGQFTEDGNVFKYENFTGRVGGSDLNGSTVYVGKKPRPMLSGELVSNLLQFSDLAPIIGADTNASKAKRGERTRQPSNKALPVEQFKTDRWKAIDADVKFTGRRIIKGPALPITDLYTHVILTDGVLTFEPLKFGVAGGTLASNVAASYKRCNLVRERGNTSFLAPRRLRHPARVFFLPC
jgi:hypothetical protein